MMLVDLHIHTNRSSYCSGLSPQELIQEATRLGLDGVAVTEHSTHRGAQIVYEMAEGHELVVFRGIEVYTDQGDMLVFGISSRVDTDMDFEKLLRVVRGEGGVIIAAHPTRGYWGHHRKYKGETPMEVLARLDGVETHNGGCPAEKNELALERARELGLPSLGGSDAHMHYSVGKCLTVFERRIRTEEELMEEIRAGRCRGAYLEEVQRQLQPEGLQG
jgi:predicted metal-dependent phosphoesterase TrpH